MDIPSETGSDGRVFVAKGAAYIVKYFQYLA